MATTGRIVYHGDDETIKKERREFSLTDEIMELINSGGGGGGGAINGVKVNGQVVNPDQAGYVGLTIPGVINNLSSNSTSDALSAKQGKVLYEYIQALQHVGHFLALWNTATGLPVTNPETSPYTYNTGDYYIVSNVAAAGGTNYKPNGSSYTINVASTTIESGDVQVNDLYFYDGYERRLLDNSGGSSVAIDTSLSTTSTNPVQNQAIANAINNLSTDVNTKTFYLASAADFTNAQAAVDWIDAGKMALVCFNGQTYVYISKTSIKYTFEDINGYTTVNNNGSTGVFLNFLEITLDNGDVDDISISSKSQSSTIPSYLATGVNYSPVYTPEYNGSPATKKYVDDKFAAVPVYTAGSNIDITSNQISTIRNGYVYVTCTDGPFVKNKTGTSAEGNYTPREGDLIMIHFTQGCSVGGPDISIDGGTAIPFYIGVESANAGNFYFGSTNVSKMFIYTNGRLVGDAVKDNNNIYYAGNGLTLTSGTFAIDPSVVATQSDLNNYATQSDLDDYLKTTDLHGGTGINIGPMSSHLPSGYQELESISSTGTQYILTGINYTSGHTYEFNHKLFVDSSTSSDKGSGWNAGAGIMMYDDSGTLKYSGGGASSIMGNAGQQLDLTISVDNGTSTYEYTIGSTTSSLTRSNSSLSGYAGNVSYPLFVSTVNNSGGTIFTSSEMTATYYYFEAKDNNVLVRKMYPAKRLADNAIGMYDVVNDQFYTNSGTGTFLAGMPTGSGYNVEVDNTVWTDPTVRAGAGITITQGQTTRLPSGYTEVEYIQSDGNCYVDTGIVSEGTDTTETKFQALGVPSSSGAVRPFFGSMEGTTLIRFSTGTYIPVGSSSTPSFFGGWNNTTQLNGADTNVHILQMVGGSSVMLDGVGTSYSHSINSHPTITSYLFARHGDGNNVQTTYDGNGTKIYYHKQFRGVIPILDLVPCVRDSDDELGFYDLVNERFLANGGSGTLTAGPEVTFDPVRVISADASALTNTRTFFLASDSDTTTAQDAVNFRASGGNPIIMLDDCAYMLNNFGIQRSADSASWEFRTAPNITDTTTKGYISNGRMVLEGSYDTQTEVATVSSISVYADMVTVEGGTHIGTSAPTSPYEGQLWYDKTNDVLKSYDGTTWNIVGGNSADLNTKTFYLSSTSDTTNAQAAYDWYAAGKNPVIVYNDVVYILYEKTSTYIKFVSLSGGTSDVSDGTSYEYLYGLKFNISSSTVSSISNSNARITSYHLRTGFDYPTPYTPQYNGSPATKKYVDDKMYSGTTAPSNPTEGQLWYDTTNDVLKVYNGTAWVAVGGGGGVNIINVEVATAYSTAAKVGTTTAGNYVPAAGDLLMVNFVNGCSTSSAPTLNIDNGTAHNIRVGNTSATSTYFSLGTTSSSNVKVLMYYDGTYYKVWSTQNTTYSGMSQSTASTGTSTTSSLISAKVLNDTIVEKAITLDPNSPLDVTTIWAGTEVQYNNLSSKGPTTAYLCVEE